MIKKIINKDNVAYWLGATIMLFIICIALLSFSEIQFSTVFTSSGIVAIISAVIGILLTVFVSSVLLKEKSGADKDVKNHEQKIKVFFEFAKGMWQIADDGDNEQEKIKNKYEKLRSMCFDKLVLILTPEEIKKMAKIIKEIDDTKSINDNRKYFCAIINVLQNSLGNKHEDESFLQELYNAFDRDEQNEIAEEDNAKNISKDRTFWHFIMWDDRQITAFKNGNWFLSLTEYGEDRRTRLLRQVKTEDIVFLYKRWSGTGYIGAFRVLDPPTKIIKGKENYSQADIDKYDIYKAINDGASFASCILVEPIAYNFKGVGYLTLRRRTIQRINDINAVNYLINGFNGVFTGCAKENVLKERYNEGKNKFDENTEVKDLNEDYFRKLVEKQNEQVNKK